MPNNADAVATGYGLLSLSRRIWLCLATAIVAAAVGDAAMEFLSDRGAFGCSDLTDHSNLNVIPTLFAGLFIALRYLYLRLRQVIFEHLEQRRVAPGKVPVAPPSGRLMRTLPATFLMQIVVLFVIETLEQYVVGGRALGGTVWLGGPPAVSLAVHALVCLSVACGAARLSGGFARAAVRFVGFMLLLIAVTARRRVLALARNTFSTSFRFQTPVLGHSGDRAPPLLTA